MRFRDWLLTDTGEGKPKTAEHAGLESVNQPPGRSRVDEIFETPAAILQKNKETNTRTKLQVLALEVSYTNFVLTVIAVTLCAITFKIFTAPTVPTPGDFLALRDIPLEERQEAHTRLLESIPLIRVKGGEIGAEITNSSIEVTGEISIVR